MTSEELEELKGLAASMGLYDDKKPCKRAVILGKAIKALEQDTVSKDSYDHEYFLRRKMETQIDHLNKYISKLETQIVEQETTTKNDLGVDYRSLEDIKKLVEYKADALDGVMLDASGVIIGLYFAIANDLPTVTPIRPKGHWIEYSWNDNGIARWGLECDKCHKKYKYGGEIWNNPNFCPNCGADMREVVEE